MIVNIRGTNGSGKSTIVRSLMRHAEVHGDTMRPIWGVLGPRLPEAYQLTLRRVVRPVYVIGSYSSPTGGCDALPSYDMIYPLLDKYSKRGHVVFEGVLIASCYGKLGATLEKYGQDAVIAFLDTPLAECLKRVGGRRSERADDRVLDPKQTTAKWNAIQRIRERVRTEKKIRAVDITTELGADKIIKLLRGAK